ncbi:heme o synthase [uncultured Chloroflexus sp.]|uniref:heme o synthase n=1 Tax=uncultured Chloroflexus sp. TaxID=214040 RepID=UPI002632F404|nr:heme o synthase [uncultured Chloroflexus sp.]
MAARHLARILVIGLLLTLATIVSGALVTISASATACPSWPLCLDALSSEANPLVWISLGHRLIVSLALLAVIASTWMVWRAPETQGAPRWTALGALALFMLQALAGALLVWGMPAMVADVWHLTGALLAFGAQTLTFLLVVIPAQPATDRLAGRAAQTQRRLRGLASWGAAAAGVAALAIGARSVAPAIEMAAALPANSMGALSFAAALTGWMAVEARWRLHPAAQTSVVALALPRYSPLLPVLALVALAGLFLPTGGHLLSLTAATLLWAGALAAIVILQRAPLTFTTTTAVARPTPKWREVVADYISLTKPKVISLLLVTTLTTMFITEAGLPSWWLVLWTMIGGYLAAGGAGAINCAFDSDIDINMGRTSRRPVPSGRISARAAFIFGVILSVLSIIVLWVFTTPLAAFFAFLGIIYYAYFYTGVLKRSTWQNIIIGGGAGAIPPLVGWTAVTGSISLMAVVLFAIIFYWTPPHFWALALVKQKDYARAGVPMLPVVAGEAETRWQILVYSAIMLAVSLLPVAIGAMSWIYLVGALLFGFRFLRDAWAVWKVGDQAAIWGLYKYSLLYLALLFAVMVADRLILG